MSGFLTLESFLLAYNINKETLSKALNTKKFPFKFPLISDYMIWRNGKCSKANTYMVQKLASKVTRLRDRSGNIKAEIVYEGNYPPSYVDYSDVVKFNLHNNTLIVIDSDKEIVFAENYSKNKQEKRSNKIKCSVCGRLITVPDSGTVICSDTSCPSSIYPRIKQFEDTLKLPNWSQDMLMKVDSLEDYVDGFILEEVDATIYQILRACLPYTVVPSNDNIRLLVSKCNNSCESILYYISNKEKIEEDLDISYQCVKPICEWFENPVHMCDLVSIIECEYIHLLESDKKFEGLPLLSGQTICLTGDFMHGSAEEVTKILKSYSADVVRYYDKSITSVLVGGHHSNIDSTIINSARSSSLPIFEELEFFDRYQIDEDLNANL